MDTDDRPAEDAYWPQFAAGAGMVALLHVFGLTLVWGVYGAASFAGAPSDVVGTVSIGATMWTLGLGVGQLAFVIPLTGLLLAVGRRAMAMGVVSAAALVFLLNSAIAACLGTLIAGGTALCIGILMTTAPLGH